MNAVNRLARTIAGVVLLCGVFTSARADDIAVANYGVAMNGMPIVIAVNKGYFKLKARPISRAC